MVWTLTATSGTPTSPLPPFMHVRRWHPFCPDTPLAHDIFVDAGGLPCRTLRIASIIFGGRLRETCLDNPLFVCKGFQIKPSQTMQSDRRSWKLGGAGRPQQRAAICAGIHDQPRSACAWSWETHHSGGVWLGCATLL